MIKAEKLEKGNRRKLSEWNRGISLKGKDKKDLGKREGGGSPLFEETELGTTGKHGEKRFFPGKKRNEIRSAGKRGSEAQPPGS